MTTSTPTVLVAAAPTLHREGLVALLREHWPHLQLCLTADASLVTDLVARQRYRLAVLDSVLPGPVLPELLARLHRVRPTQRLLLLMDYDRSVQSIGPLARHPPATAPARAPTGLGRGPVAVAGRPGGSAGPAGRGRHHGPPFSPRELEVLRLVVADHCNHEIADRLCLSVRTVESHRRTLGAWPPGPCARAGWPEKFSASI